MNYSKNLKSFFGSLPIKSMTGHQLFLALAAHIVGGDISVEIDVLSLRKKWYRSLLKKSYNPNYYSRAQEANWVDPVSKGIFTINKEGISHLLNLSSHKNGRAIKPLESSALHIFDKKSPHTFDKFLRTIFANSKKKVLVADSWVDERIFDNILDSVPKTNDLDLLYGQKKGTFDSRIARFSKEYPKFAVRRYKYLHDRFLVIDDIGYIVGPSLKDAAEKSPALIVSLSPRDSELLKKFFQSIWSKSK